MKKYSIPIQIRWADIDQNRHLRHSAYYDYCAAARVTFLNEHGLTTEKMEEMKIGPVLFREEAVFKREIRLEDKITVDVEILKATADYSRWSIRHHIIRQGDVVAAIVQVDGAWIDLEKRKLALPDDFIKNIFKDFPVSPEFQLIPDKR